MIVRIARIWISTCPVFLHQINKIKNNNIKFFINLFAGIGRFIEDKTVAVEAFSNDMITPLFEATVQSVEKAIINAMISAEKMEGINGNKAYALPHALLINVLKKYKKIE